MRRAPSVLLLALGVAAVPVGGCRQTVMFDTGVDGGGGTGGGTGGRGGGSAFCPGGQTRRLDFALRSPDVIPALDRASGMQRALGSSTRLAAARAALSALVGRYAAAVRFGFVDFPGTGSACLGDPVCCPSDALPPSHGAQAFEAALHACDDPSACPVTSDRPTAQALYESSRVFANFPTRNRRYLLLVTDGQPGCGIGEASGCGLAQDQATRLAQMTPTGVTLHVVAIDSSSDCLQGVANRGGGNFSRVDSTSELNATLEEILEPIARQACNVDVLSPPDAREQVALLHNGEEIPRSRTNGWDFDGNSGTSLTLYGDACDIVLEEGAANLDLRACNP